MIARDLAQLHGDTVELAQLGNNLSKATVFTETNETRPGFGERVQKDGLREALKWRDAAWQGTELWDYAKRPSPTSPTSAT